MKTFRGASQRTADIFALEREGFFVEAFGPNHFRIDGGLDLFPLHRTFHDLQSGRRGTYDHALSIAVQWLYPLE